MALASQASRFSPVRVRSIVANYAPSALQKASSSIPRILTLNGDQMVSMRMEHNLGIKPAAFNAQKVDIDPDYFAAFESMQGLLVAHMKEDTQNYRAVASSGAGDSQTEQAIDLEPEEDLISLNALGYALRVDPAQVRRWVEYEAIQPDASQVAGDRTSYYFRRDHIEQIRKNLGLGSAPTSSDEWKQEFLDFAKSRNLSRSYKPVMIKAFFKLVDREGKAHIDDLVKEFRDYYVLHLKAGQPLEQSSSLMVDPLAASDQAMKRLIVTNPLERFLIKNFIEYFSDEGVLQIAPQVWRELRHYEVMDTLRNADEQLRYYVSRSNG